MTGRRSFIKNSTLSISAGLLLGMGKLSFSNRKRPRFEIDKQDDFWKGVRAQFPLTEERIYFNNGTIGPSPYPVIEAVNSTFLRLNTWGEYKGHDDSREPIANFINASKEEISLTHNTTEGINIVAAGLRLESGDEVIMTTHEHAGNALPWLNQQKRKGIVIKPFNPASNASENLNLINELITPRTRVIAIPHITCTTGLMLPVKEISRLGHEKGLWVFIDGAHTAGSRSLNVKEIGCDFYASCGHKWLLGPSGTGFLYVRKEMLDELDPICIGAYSDTGWEISLKKQKINGYVPTAHRFDYGTQSASLAHGLKAAIEFMDTIGMEKVESYSTSLADTLFDGLESIGQPIEVLTPREKISRSTMVTFRIKGLDYTQFGKTASDNNFRIRLVPESRLNAIRISTHIYNNPDQIEEFLDLVRKIIKS